MRVQMWVVCEGMVGVLRYRSFTKVKARFMVPVLLSKLSGIPSYSKTVNSDEPHR